MVCKNAIASYNSFSRSIAQAIEYSFRTKVFTWTNIWILHPKASRIRWVSARRRFCTWFQIDPWPRSGSIFCWTWTWSWSWSWSRGHVHEEEDGQQEEKSYGEDVDWAPCAAPPAQGVWNTMYQLCHVGHSMPFSQTHHAENRQRTQKLVGHSVCSTGFDLSGLFTEIFTDHSHLLFQHLSCLNTCELCFSYFLTTANKTQYVVK